MSIDKTQLRQGIVFHLIHNQQYYKDMITPYTKRRDNFLIINDKVFHDDINNQYWDMVKSVIASDLNFSLAVSYEDAIVVLEEINLKEYLDNETNT